MFFLFVHTNSGLDHTQVATIVAWPIPTLLLLARSGSRRMLTKTVGGGGGANADDVDAAAFGT